MPTFRPSRRSSKSLSDPDAFGDEIIFIRQTSLPISRFVNAHCTDDNLPTICRTRLRPVSFPGDGLAMCQWTNLHLPCEFPMPEAH